MYCIIMKILCIIPARSGSKGVKNKNIKLFRNKPLLAWSIEQAKQSKYIQNMKIIVSTDSEIYQKISLEWEAECPFLRPKNISQDNSTDIEFMKHCVKWLKQNENYVPDIILQLRPTSPLRNVNDIDNALDIFIENRNNYDSLRSVIKVNKTPYKMYNIIGDNLIPLFSEVNNIIEPYNQCRQILPQCYVHNGYIDILNANILENNTISGNKIYPFVMNLSNNIDIDNEEDWMK